MLQRTQMLHRLQDKTQENRTMRCEFEETHVENEITNHAWVFECSVWRNLFVCLIKFPLAINYSNDLGNENSTVKCWHWKKTCSVNLFTFLIFNVYLCFQFQFTRHWTAAAGLKFSCVVKPINSQHFKIGDVLINALKINALSIE